MEGGRNGLQLRTQGCSIHRSPTMTAIQERASSSRASTPSAIKIRGYARLMIQRNVSGEQRMPRTDNLTRLGYMAFILGWLGYASLISASPLKLESTPIFLVFKVESNIMFLI